MSERIQFTDRETLEIALTQGYSTVIDAVDEPLIRPWHWYAATARNGICAQAWDNGITRRMHRVIMKAIRGQVVDHIDGNPLNNRRENLRLCTMQQNCQNAGKHRPNPSSQFKGVTFVHKTGKWKATICKDFQLFHLGYFATDVEAALAYDVAARDLFGEFARPNFEVGTWP